MLACPIRSATIFGSTPASSEVVANVGVPHVVQADALDSGPVDELVEPVGDRVGVHRPPVLVADEPPSIVVAVPERLLFGVQHGQVAAQVGDGQRVEGDHAPPAFGLAVRLFGLAVDDDPRVSDFEHRAVEVEQSPFGAGEFGAAHAGCRGQNPNARVAVGDGHREPRG